jgi:hypothetical protein
VHSRYTAPVTTIVSAGPLQPPPDMQHANRRAAASLRWCCCNGYGEVALYAQPDTVEHGLTRAITASTACCSGGLDGYPLPVVGWLKFGFPGIRVAFVVGKLDRFIVDVSGCDDRRSFCVDGR